MATPVREPEVIIVQLKAHIAQLESENADLKKENPSLKARLDAYKSKQRNYPLPTTVRTGMR
jgi:regulator of replication initiation timing